MYNYTVKLNSLKFDATHGLYKDEKTVNQPFQIDIEVSYQRGKTCNDTIENSVNYENLYLISKAIVIDNTFSLIETIGEKIIQKVFETYSHLQFASVTIRKPRIQFDNNCKCVEVVISRTNE